MTDPSKSQTWDPERYARNARFVAELGLPLLELLAPQPGERILDLGCGDGALTEELATRGCSVVGIDGSVEQVRAARARGLQAFVMDAQSLQFEGEFDAVFSNAALHWMPRQVDVMTGVWRALKPGGRFVAESGGQDNIRSIRTALYAALRRRGFDPEPLDPWHFMGADDCARQLADQGFEVAFVTQFARPTRLPGDIAGWLATFAESFITILAASERPAFVNEVREELAPDLCDELGRWTADYVRLRFVAQRPPETAQA